MDDAWVETIARAIYNVTWLAPAWEQNTEFARGTAILQARAAVALTAAAHAEAKRDDVVSRLFAAHRQRDPNLYQDAAHTIQELRGTLDTLIGSHPSAERPPGAPLAS